VAEDQKEADSIKSKVQQEEAEVRTQADQVAIVQADAQADLDVAMPALQKAVTVCARQQPPDPLAAVSLLCRYVD
jgi:hypothetical protein